MAKGSSSREKGVLHSIQIIPTDDGKGVIAHNEMKIKRGGQGGGPMYDHETHTTIHPTLDSIHEHIATHCQHCFSEGEPREPEKAEDGGGKEY